MSHGKPGRAFQVEGTVRAGGRSLFEDEEGVYTGALLRVQCSSQSVMGQFLVIQLNHSDVTGTGMPGADKGNCSPLLA